MSEQGVRWKLSYEYMAEPDYGDIGGSGVKFTEEVSTFDDETGKPIGWLITNTIGRRVMIPGQASVSKKEKQRRAREALVDYLNQVIEFVKKAE